MLFSVIVATDAPRGDHPIIRRSLVRALGMSSTESDYRYLGEESATDPEGWLSATERKGSGILTRSQFATLLEDLGNPEPSETETLGSFGGPLAPWGGVVADINWELHGYVDYILCLRVTPIPRRGSVAKSPGHAKRKWRRIRRAVLSHYADGRDRRRATSGPKYAAAVRREMNELCEFCEG